jgi:hypothetical protein
MSDTTQNSTGRRIGPLQISIIVLAVATGLVHLYRGIMMTFLTGGRNFGAGSGGGQFRTGGGGGTGRLIPGGGGGGGALGGAGRFLGGRGGPLSLIYMNLSTLFFLNAACYLALAIALYLPAFHSAQRAIRWLLLGFAVLTIIAWFVVAGPQPNVLGYSDKIIEITLIVLLIIDAQKARRAEASDFATQGV